mgnify:CR=1 FL=1|tara:strand:- start:8149 stop:9498 length:1350 start_codon:yes stop_codon:yes gene_type:complete
MERERHLKNLKVISKLAKNKKNNSTQKKNLGKNLIKSMQGMGCNPEKFLYLPDNKSISLSIENSSSLGTKKIGQGSFGDVYMGCIDKECKKKVAIKIVINEDISHEYKTGKKISLYGGIKTYSIQKCNNITFMYSEYANSGTLKSFLKNNRNNILPIHFRTIVTQILYNLYRIQKKYPSFRHNDLHADNVLINSTSPSRVKLYKVNNSTLKVHDIGIQALISDYGLSTVNGIKNPEVDNDPKLFYKTKSGIFRGSHPMYDIQYFLNALRQEIRMLGIHNGMEVIQFIERILPREYLGVKSDKIDDFRLRAQEEHPKLPTFKQIFNDRYFSPYKKAVVPIDISTIIKRNTKVKIPIARKKTMNEIKRNLASKNIKKTVLKRPGIRIQPKPVPKSVPKVVMTNKGYIRIGTRKCQSYRKPELVKIAKNMGINTDGKTINKLCENIKLKYIK